MSARTHTRHVLQQPGYGQLLLTASALLQGAPFVAPPAEAAAPSLLDFADRRLHRLLKRVHELADAARVATDRLARRGDAESVALAAEVLWRASDFDGAAKDGAGYSCPTAERSSPTAAMGRRRGPTVRH